MSNLIAQLIQYARIGDREAIDSSITQLLDDNVNLKLNWLMLAKICSSVGLISLTARALAKAQPYIRTIEHHLTYYCLLINVGKQNQAFLEAKTIFKNVPTNLALAHFLGTLSAQLGKRNESKKYLEQALSLNINAGESWLAFVELDLPIAEYKNAINILTNGIQELISFQSKASMYTALAKLYLKSNDKQNAIIYFEQAAQLMNAQTQFNFKQESCNVNTIIANSKNFSGLKTQANDAKFQPIFILGLPRSGTTLLEQLIASYQSVLPTGESNAIALACMPHLNKSPMGCDAVKLNNMATDNILKKVKQDYCKFVEEKFGVNKYIVDKSLNNSRYLDVMLNLFPNASIIYIERDTQDTAWSCFKTFFSQGLTWSWSYKNIAKFIKLEKHLMTHWLSQYPDNIHSVKYEQLVNSPDETMTDVARFCGFSNPNFSHKKGSENFVKTASTEQVRKPISNNSINSAIIKNPYLLNDAMP